MYRPNFGILLAGVVACRAVSVSPGINPTVAAAPGAAWLATLRLGADARPWHVTIRGVRDSVDRLLGDKMVTQSVIAPAEAEQILIVSAWRPPLMSIDSMTIAPHGLRPIREVLAYNGFTRHYQFAGNHVWGTVQHADSAQRKFDRVFPEPLFAFSEVDLLVRAAPFRVGWSVVVPLFSESDEDVEHDTITVLSSTRAARGGRDEAAWLIRFADPAIVSTYTVLAGTREILSIETEQRRTHAIGRYRDGSGQSSGSYLMIDSSRVYYEECGKENAGPTIVLLHDGLLHSVTWNDVWPLVCARHHALRYDRRGMGRSDPSKKPFIPTEDLTALLADRGVASPTLVGSSSGVGLAIDYAFRHPDKVDRLVLIGPVVHGMASSEHFLARGAANNAPLARADVRAAAQNWANDRFQIAAGHDAARHELFDALAANPQDLTYQGNLELRFAVPAAARIGEIHVPTLVLVGEADIPDVQAYAGAVELGIWGAKREVVAGVGHLLQLEVPAFLARRIDEFIAQTPLVAVSPDRLKELAGRYDFLMYGRAGEFAVSDGRLVVRVPTERDLPLFASSDSTFYALAWGGVRFAFHADSTSRVVSVDVTDVGGTHRSTRATERS